MVSQMKSKCEGSDANGQGPEISRKRFIYYCLLLLPALAFLVAACGGGGGGGNEQQRKGHP
jgi:hypothetical protein